MIINADPIGNKGIKNLMKIEMNRLIQFELLYTNITSDVIKLLKKKVKLQSGVIGVSQLKFDNIRFHR